MQSLLTLQTGSPAAGEAILILDSLDFSALEPDMPAFPSTNTTTYEWGL
jgi:hypothetical protein